MLPFINLFGREFPMYSVCTGIGLVLALIVAMVMCPKFRVKRDDCLYVLVWGGVGALVGAKVLYLCTVLPNLIADFHFLWDDFPVFMERYVSGGLVMYGGLIGAVAGAVLSCKYFGWKLGDYLPVVMPVFPLVHAFGRVGCFCAGCCWGIPVDWGIAFTQSIGAPNGVKLMPVQLIEAACELVIWAVLVWYAFRRPSNLRLLGAYCVMYAPVRFVLEFFRGDLIRGHVLWLSTSQWISIAILAVGLVLLLGKRGKAPQTGPVDGE